MERDVLYISTYPRLNSSFLAASGRSHIHNTGTHTDRSFFPSCPCRARYGDREKKGGERVGKRKREGIITEKFESSSERGKMSSSLRSMYIRMCVPSHSLSSVLNFFG